MTYKGYFSNSHSKSNLLSKLSSLESLIEMRLRTSFRHDEKKNHDPYQGLLVLEFKSPGYEVCSNVLGIINPPGLNRVD